MSHAIDYINGFESLINEYKQDGYPSSPEAIYTNTTLKLNGFKSDSIVGSEGFISDVAKKFWQGILAIYNWFKSLFSSSKERKLDEMQKALAKTIKEIYSIDANQVIFKRVSAVRYESKLDALRNKMTFNVPTNTATPYPVDLLYFIRYEGARIEEAIKKSSNSELTPLLKEIKDISFAGGVLKNTDFFRNRGGERIIGNLEDIGAELPIAIKYTIQLRQKCNSAVESGSKTINNNSSLLNNEIYKSYSKFVTRVIKNVVKLQNVLVNETTDLLRQVSKEPEFKSVDFGPLIDLRIRDLVVEDTVKDLA